MLAAVALCLATAHASAGPLAVDPDQARDRASAAARAPGAMLLWVRDGRILRTQLDDWSPRPAAQDVPGRLSRPRWSPDGSRFLFQRDDAAIYVKPGDGGPARLVLAGAATADWTADGRHFTAISIDGHQVLIHDLDRGATRVLHDTRQPPFHGQKLAQAAELHPGGRYLLTFRREPSHATEIVDLVANRYLSNPGMRRGDCNPAWTPEGRFVLTTARTTNRPILFAPFDPASGALGPSQFLAGLKGWSRYALHDPRPSSDGHWLVASGEVLLGPGMRGGEEIYLWHRGDPSDRLVRLTFDSSDDTLPSLFVPPAPGAGRTG